MYILFFYELFDNVLESFNIEPFYTYGSILE